MSTLWKASHAGPARNARPGPYNGPELTLELNIQDAATRAARQTAAIAHLKQKVSLLICLKRCALSLVSWCAAVLLQRLREMRTPRVAIEEGWLAAPENKHWQRTLLKYTVY